MVTGVGDVQRLARTHEDTARTLDPEAADLLGRGPAGSDPQDPIPVRVGQVDIAVRCRTDPCHAPERRGDLEFSVQLLGIPVHAGKRNRPRLDRDTVQHPPDGRCGEVEVQERGLVAHGASRPIQTTCQRSRSRRPARSIPSFSFRPGPSGPVTRS